MKNPKEQNGIAQATKAVEDFKKEVADLVREKEEIIKQDLKEQDAGKLAEAREKLKSL